MRPGAAQVRGRCVGLDAPKTEAKRPMQTVSPRAVAKDRMGAAVNFSMVTLPGVPSAPREWPAAAFRTQRVAV